MPCQLLINHLQALNLGPIQSVRGLTIFPLRNASSNVQIASLSAARISEDVTVREVSDSGQVQALKVENRGAVPLFLLDGEELLGGKQARVVNSSVLIPPHRETIIPVSCCEAGRWRRDRDDFGSGGRSMPSSMKFRKSLRVSENLRRSGQHDGDQQRVWADIQEYSTSRGVSSSTSALGAVFDADRHELQAYLDGIKVLPDQVGCAAFIGGRLAGIELFASPELYRDVHSKVVHSFAADALMTSSRRPARVQERRRLQRIREILESRDIDTETILEIEEAIQTQSGEDGESALRFASRVLEGEATTHPTAGLGTDIRVRGASGEATALVLDEQVVHLSIFPPREPHLRERVQR
jgi:hypothetical protein